MHSGNAVIWRNALRERCQQHYLVGTRKAVGARSARTSDATGDGKQIRIILKKEYAIYMTNIFFFFIDSFANQIGFYLFIRLVINIQSARSNETNLSAK